MVETHMVAVIKLQSHRVLFGSIGYLYERLTNANNTIAIRSPVDFLLDGPHIVSYTQDRPSVRAPIARLGNGLEVLWHHLMIQLPRGTRAKLGHDIVALSKKSDVEVDVIDRLTRYVNLGYAC